MRLLLTLIIAFLFTTLANANNLMREGKGQFLALPTDSVSFVKAQLFHSSVEEILKQELALMGLDATLFFDRVNEKFTEYFGPTESKLREKYKIMPEDNGLSNSDFQNELRTTRLALKAKFGNLEGAVISYSILEIGKSQDLGGLKTMTLSDKISRKVLGETYARFVREAGSNREITTIYLDANFKLDGMTWRDTGVILEEDFTSVVKEHWKKSVADKLAPSITNVVVVTPSESEKIRSLLKRGPFTYDSIEQTEYGIFKDAALLKFEVRISKVAEEPLLSLRTFQVDSDFVLIDLLTGKILIDQDLGVSKEKISYKTEHDLSSNLATFIYQKPLTEIGNLKSRLSQIKINDSSIKLTIKSVKSVKDVFDISRILTSNGSSLDLSTNLKKIEGSVAQLDIEYTGKRDSLVRVVASLADSPLPSGNQVKINEDNHFEIEIKESVQKE